MSGPVLCSYSKMLLQEHFDVYDLTDLKIGDEVIIDTRRGLEFGRVVGEPGATRMRRNESSAGRVMRRATFEDRQKHQAEQVRVKKRPEVRRANDFARQHKLEMTFIEIEETFDERKLIFYFIAPKRVDFREMVREMAQEFSKKIELRQIGDRDVARLTGDVGSCGQELCCKTFLLDFVPVTMRMAKNQGLGLDNSKISGMCGRLKCCLKYEDELYTQLRKTMPISGQPATRIADGTEGWVCALNVLNQTIVLNIKGSREEMPVEDIEFDPKMSERQVRRWQKEMREGLRLEAEERRREKEERAKAKANRGRAKATAGPKPESKVESEKGEQAIKTEGQPNKKKRRRRRGGKNRSGGGEKRDGESQGGQRQQDGGVEGPKDGQPRKKRRRRRGGRGRRKPGEGGRNSGGGDAGGGEG